MLILINLFPCLMWGKQLLLVGYDLLGEDAAILAKKVKSHFSNKSLLKKKKKFRELLSLIQLRLWQLVRV